MYACEYKNEIRFVRHKQKFSSVFCFLDFIFLCCSFILSEENKKKVKQLFMEHAMFVFILFLEIMLYNVHVCARVSIQLNAIKQENRFFIEYYIPCIESKHMKIL